MVKRSQIMITVMLWGLQTLADSPLPTYSWINKNIFQPKCATQCHQPGNPDGDVEFLSYQVLLDSEGLLDKPIVPGSPEESGVWIQVHRKTMPKSLEKLSDPEVKAIYDWIKDGAKENEPLPSRLTQLSLGKL